MSKRAVRLLVFLLAVAAVAAGGYELLRSERAAATARVSDAQFDDLYARALRAAFDLRTSQQALLIPQQGIDWWEERGRTAAADLDAVLQQLKQLAVEPEALNDLDAATAALEALRSTQIRVLNAVRDHDRAGAATIVYGEGFEQSRTILDRLASAREAEASARAQRHTLSVQRNAAVAGAAAGLALLACLLLVARGRTPSLARADAPANGSLLDLTLRPDARAAAHGADETVRTARVQASRATADEVTPSTASAIAAPSATATPAEVSPAAASPAPPIRDRRKAPELRAAADLCTDFARLLEPQELPGLLERAARLLDAQGLIVWIADDTGHLLTPTLSHGYPPQAIARLPAIGRDDDNATAAAFRVGELQVVKTNGMEPGAIAVPLITASGCVGVMAAEVRHGREASESARAISRIVAAQLATLVQVRPAGEQIASSSHEATG